MAFVLTSPADVGANAFSIHNDSATPYTGGEYYGRSTFTGGVWSYHGQSGTDMEFRTFVEVAAPEPASLALFGLALAGLGLARRRRRAGRA